MRRPCDRGSWVSWDFVRRCRGAVACRIPSDANLLVLLKGPSVRDVPLFIDADSGDLCEAVYASALNRTPCTMDADHRMRACPDRRGCSSITPSGTFLVLSSTQASTLLNLLSAASKNLTSRARRSRPGEPQASFGLVDRPANRCAAVLWVWPRRTFSFSRLRGQQGGLCRRHHAGSEWVQ